ncbi:diaminopimelate decarboxylase [Tissierella sp. MSJ-40]|uniref:Diaminopimelate decarboxylase n=1 Tax=Tissierella simiarum TaxID=2841534 RepID=A0ABS6E8K5_9FIRM|nr:diaminopimelate decarboxylase [Tissierella simiarum]MBU5438563.1 diaminopimelate decarboxylase [Tissierella simiarum]
MSNYIFAQCDTVELVKKYDTPLYVVSEDYIVDRIAEIKEDFIEKYDNVWAVYASKAFLTKEMARIVNREGIGIDVVSGGELYTAIKADFPMDKIIFHGNSKTYEELEMAIINEVGRIVVDNLDELHQLNELAKKYDKVINILYRITPGVSIDTHKYIQTGQVDSKFGVPLGEDRIYEAIEKAINSSNINLLGFHFHVGSQLHKNNTHLEAIEIGINVMREAKEKFDFETKELNVGGGFGIKYADSENRKPIAFFTEPIMEKIISTCSKFKLNMPKIIIEPGRWIVGEAGITLYNINSVKEIPNIRTYVGIDGGMPDNPRPSLYNAKYEAIIANKVDEKPTELVTIAGKCCETGDILIWDLKVPKIQSGDILAVLSTGAYNYSMASNYNKIPKPAVVMIKDGVDRIIVKRETYDDILRNEV